MFSKEKRFLALVWRSKLSLLVAVFILSLSSLLRAQTVSEATQHSAPAYMSGSAATSVEEIAFSLALVLVLIFFLAWVVKRFAPGAGRMGSRYMTVLASIPLGGKERLMLVDVAGTQMVLGVSSAGVECLHVFPEPVVTQSRGSGNTEASFGKILQHFKADREKR